MVTLSQQDAPDAMLDDSGDSLDMQEFWDDRLSDGYSPQQITFARAIVSGKNATQAALVAKYGDPKFAAQSGSRTLRTKRVRELIRLARVYQDGALEDGDSDECRKILWRWARSSNAAAAIRGAEILARFYTTEKPEPVISPAEFLDDLHRSWGDDALPIIRLIAEKDVGIDRTPKPETGGKLPPVNSAVDSRSRDNGAGDSSDDLGETDEGDEAGETDSDIYRAGA